MSDAVEFEQAVSQLEYHLIEALAACSTILQIPATTDFAEALGRVVAPLADAMPNVGAALEQWASLNAPALQHAGEPSDLAKQLTL